MGAKSCQGRGAGLIGRRRDEVAEDDERVAAHRENVSKNARIAYKLVVMGLVGHDRRDPHERLDA